MGGVVSAVTDAVSSVVSSVGDAVEDVGDVVVDEVVKPVAKAVESTVQAAVDDPIGTAIKVAAVASGNPALMAAANAAVAVAHGADLNEAALAAGKGYIGGEIAQGVGGELAPDIGVPAANVAGGVAGATATGGDPVAALVSGGIGAGTNAALGQVDGYSDLTPAQQSIVRNTVATTLRGGDPSAALVNAAINAGIREVAAMKSDFTPPKAETAKDLSSSDYTNANKYSLTGTDGLGLKATPTPIDYSNIGSGIEPVDYSLSTTQGDGIGLQMPTSPAIKSMGGAQGLTLADNLGTYGELGYTPSGASPVLGDSSSFINNPNVTGNFVMATDPAYGNNFSMNFGSGTGGTFSSGAGAGQGSNVNIPAPAAPLSATTPNLLGTGTADITGKQAAFLNPLELVLQTQRNQVLSPAINDSFEAQDTTEDVVPASKQAPSSYYSYGVEPATAANNFGFGETKTFAQGGHVAPLQSATGGALPHHTGRMDFRHGAHVAGEGDGQSDDIPAMLADGEFVIPADVVSALGNGSTKAGTDKLYEMMHGVRERARSTKVKDLPPPAKKSPLDYLKKK